MLDVQLEDHHQELRHHVKKLPHIFHQLFLWAVINNMPDMADEFLSRGNDMLRKCLIGERASKLMVKIGSKRNMADGLVSEFKKNEK